MRYIRAMAHGEEFRFAAELADAFMVGFYLLLVSHCQGFIPGCPPDVHPELPSCGGSTQGVG